MTLFPYSLKGRLFLFMMMGTLLAMAISGTLYLRERGRTLYYAGGIQTAERFAAIVRLLDPLDNETRTRLASALETPHQFIRFSDTPVEMNLSQSPYSAQAKFVHALLERYLEQTRALQVSVLDQRKDAKPLLQLQGMGLPASMVSKPPEATPENPAQAEATPSSPNALAQPENLAKAPPSQQEKAPKRPTNPAPSQASRSASTTTSPSSGYYPPGLYPLFMWQQPPLAMAGQPYTAPHNGLSQAGPSTSESSPQAMAQPLAGNPFYSPYGYNPYNQALPPQTLAQPGTNRGESNKAGTPTSFTPSSPFINLPGFSRSGTTTPGIETSTTPGLPFPLPLPGVMTPPGFDRPMFRPAFESPLYPPQAQAPKSEKTKQAITQTAKDLEPAPPLEKRLLPDGLAFVAQVRLHDGVWAIFHNNLPETLFEEPRRLLFSISILFGTILLITWYVVHQAVRPLGVLAKSAEALGRDIQRPPLLEKGSREMRQAASALNVMQARILRYVQERTHLLGALSHDLKTPMTRLRLRAEMMEDETLRQKILTDLAEMESMAACSLDFIRGMESGESYETIDLNSMLEQIFAEHSDMGHEVKILCDAMPPVTVKPKSLKRCLDNLIKNACNYGKRAYVRAGTGRNGLHIVVADDGPGIPEEELEKVFEPFRRLESSRNRKSGGTGLGLGIARNIARSHQGDLLLRNRPEGGLEAVISLPTATQPASKREK
ncbi:periplasmic sensor signal transduction histidine kinase [Magnetococcus marinus MC-1]|uniref:histidine kinase n=1 Tax=Magnetococcus marinus (strain ATCC BAA-1437 / JCM 17883 / MC-1) TaxID=156889 RepID=A0LA53_MAGMM|nr:ATP-binding protein [Magnetococcus marinus]ABK44846.1 periplasmic sensor signal transduction histidine kinase [Magnetococcus marinus MC-1]